MLVDAALTTTDLHEVPDAARAIEAAGYDGIYSFEGPHDAHVPAAARGRAHRARAAHDRGGHRVRAQPDDARAVGLRPAARVARPLQSRARHADQAAHREAVLDGVVEAGGAHARDGAGHPRDLGALARGHEARLPRRVLHAHADDAVLRSRPEPVRRPAHLPRRCRTADDRGRGRGRRRLHDPPVLDREVHARDDAARARARARRRAAGRARSSRSRSRRWSSSPRPTRSSPRGATRCAPASRSTARRPRTRWCSTRTAGATCSRSSTASRRRATGRRWPR